MSYRVQTSLQWEPHKLSGMTMKPDATKHNSDPDYLRPLFEKTGMGTRRVSEALGIGNRDFRHYLAGTRTCPYTVQFALECLAEDSEE